MVVELVSPDFSTDSRAVKPLRISRKLFGQMTRKGVFEPGQRVELLDGRLYEMPAMDHPHRAVLNHVNTLLVKSLPETWHINCQTPIAVNDFGEPEPDFAIVRGGTRDFRDRHPTPADIACLIEISDVTLAHDRRRKLHVYAEAGLREYWIINLVDHAVEVRTEPRPRDGNTRGTYAVLHEYRGEEKVPLRLDGHTIAEFPVTELIPL